MTGHSRWRLRIHSTDGQGQVGVDGIEILPLGGVDAKINHRLKDIDGDGGGGHPQNVFPVPPDVAEAADRMMPNRPTATVLHL